MAAHNNAGRSGPVSQNLRKSLYAKMVDFFDTMTNCSIRTVSMRSASNPMKITDLRCAVIGNHPIVRIVTDEGISGFSQIESYKPYMKPHVLLYKEEILGEDPTDVERVMLRIRQRGSFKPWGAAVSAIEMALWDIAGKAAGVPVYKLLGGKVRDRVRVYNGAIRTEVTEQSPAAYAASVREMKSHPYGFSIVKMGVAFHSNMRYDVPNFMYGDAVRTKAHGFVTRGPLTPNGFNFIVECVEAMREELGSDIGLALDCGPGFLLPDAIRLARELERLNIAWMEDTLTGDYVPWIHPDVYRDLTMSTTIPIHTGEQIYLRHNFKDLIQKQAVRIVGPDPCDVGGIAELKWIAEFADMYGVMMAPHGTGNGLLGLAALVNVAATLPSNYIAFEMPTGRPAWWFDIVDGLPDPLVVDGHIAVWDRPGMGVEINPERAAPYLLSEDADFFS